MQKIDKLPYESMRLRTKAAVLIAATSGLGVEELYELTLNNNLLQTYVYGCFVGLKSWKPSLQSGFPIMLELL